MSGIQFKVEHRKHYKAVSADMDRALMAALYEEGSMIMDDSKSNYVPVLSGALRLTGHVSEPFMGRNGPEVSLSYEDAGTAAAAYAQEVHEAPPNWGQGKNKYLEKPVNAALPGFGNRLKTRMQAHL